MKDRIRRHETDAPIAAQATPAPAPELPVNVKDHCGPHIKTALDRLIWLATNAKSEATQLAACNALLDRSLGKPVQALGFDPEMPDGARLNINVTTIELVPGKAAVRDAQ